MRLTDRDFYSLTLRQLDALLKRREHEIQIQEFLFAQLTACTVNFSMCRPKDLVSPRDFMPSEWDKPAPRQRKVRITKKVRDNITLSFRSLATAVRQASKRNPHAACIHSTNHRP